MAQLRKAKSNVEISLKTQQVFLASVIGGSAFSFIFYVMMVNISGASINKDFFVNFIFQAGFPAAVLIVSYLVVKEGPVSTANWFRALLLTCVVMSIYGAASLLVSYLGNQFFEINRSEGLTFWQSNAPQYILMTVTLLGVLGIYTKNRK